MKIIALFLAVLMFTGCATMRRHPVATGLLTGAAVGITVGVLTRQHSCAYTYDGKPTGSGTDCPYHQPKDSVKR
jgi:hypothetical protein